MPVDITAFRKLISNRVTSITRVTRVTRVTANEFSNLAGHNASAHCVTRVTEPVVRSRGHALYDDRAQDCVTQKNMQKQLLAQTGHAVTRSRRQLRGETESKLKPAKAAVCGPEGWLASVETSTDFQEHRSGFDHAESEQLSSDRMLAALGLTPGTLH